MEELLGKKNYEGELSAEERREIEQKLGATALEATAKGEKANKGEQMQHDEKEKSEDKRAEEGTKRGEEEAKQKLAELTAKEKELQTQYNRMVNDQRGIERIAKGQRSDKQKSTLNRLKTEMPKTKREWDKVRAEIKEIKDAEKEGSSELREELEAQTDRFGNPELSEETVDNIVAETASSEEGSRAIEGAVAAAVEETFKQQERLQEAEAKKEWAEARKAEAMRTIDEVNDDDENADIMGAGSVAEAESAAFRSAYPREQKMAKIVWGIGKINDITEQLERGGADQGTIDEVRGLSEKLSEELTELNKQVQQEKEDILESTLAEYGGRGNADTSRGNVDRILGELDADAIINDPEQNTQDKIILAQVEELAGEKNPSLVENIKRMLRARRRETMPRTETLSEPERMGLGAKIMEKFRSRKETLRKVMRKVSAGFAVFMVATSIAGCAKNGEVPAGAKNDPGIMAAYESVVENQQAPEMSDNMAGGDFVIDLSEYDADNGAGAGAGISSEVGTTGAGEQTSDLSEALGDVTRDLRYEEIPGAAKFDYTDMMNYANKGNAVNFGTSKAEFYGNREGSIMSFLETCRNMPEALAANVSPFQTVMKAAGLNGNETAEEIDAMLSLSEQGAELQTKLLAAFEKALGDENTKIDFFKEYRETGSYWTYTADGKTFNPNAVRLGRSERVSRIGDPMMRIALPIYDADGQLVAYEEGEFALECGWQASTLRKVTETTPPETTPPETTPPETTPPETTPPETTPPETTPPETTPPETTPPETTPPETTPPETTPPETTPPETTPPETTPPETTPPETTPPETTPPETTPPETTPPETTPPETTPPETTPPETTPPETTPPETTPPETIKPKDEENEKEVVNNGGQIGDVDANPDINTDGQNKPTEEPTVGSGEETTKPNEEVKEDNSVSDENKTPEEQEEDKKAQDEANKNEQTEGPSDEDFEDYVNGILGLTGNNNNTNAAAANTVENAATTPAAQAETGVTNSESATEQTMRAYPEPGSGVVPPRPVVTPGAGGETVTPGTPIPGPTGPIQAGPITGIGEPGSPTNPIPTPRPVEPPLEVM